MTEWVLRWESVHPFYRMEAFFEGHKKHLVVGSEYKKLMCISRRNIVAMYYDRDDIDNNRKRALAILENQKVMKEYFEAVLNNNSEVVETAKDCLDRLDELDNSPLADIYAKIIHYTQVLMCNYDLSRPEFLEDAGEKIKKNLKSVGVKEQEIDKIFNILTTSTEISLLDREALEWYALIRASKKGEPVEMLLGAHQQKYGWIGMSEKNDVWSIKHYEKQFVRDKELDVDALTNKKNVIKRDLLEAQEELAKEYSLDSDSLSLLETIKKLSEVRLGTRLSWVLSGYYIDLLFQEISKRVGIDKEELNMYKADEMDTLLRSGEKVDVEVRKNYSVKLDNGKIEYYFGLSETKIMEDTELPKVDYSKVTEVKGSIANHGKVTGRVKKIYSFSEDQDKEIRDMKKGDILVTGMTRPHLMLALRKCGAIVTDEGGITSHAAIISRELNKPCVIGTKIATKVFNDGDMVEVDADKGIVRKIR